MIGGVKFIKPTRNIKQMLEEVGYPFKSKEHSAMLSRFQENGMTEAVERYIDLENKRPIYHCPKMLRYQFTEEFELKISDKCCHELKVRPLEKWSWYNNKPYAITGIMADEWGRRRNSHCLVFEYKTMKRFNPLAPVTKDFIKYVIEKYDLDICDLYKKPYLMRRTGCKGCPFDLALEISLYNMERYFPNERKQCELIWKPVYDEYRRLKYRLGE